MSLREKMGEAQRAGRLIQLRPDLKKIDTALNDLAASLPASLAKAMEDARAGRVVERSFDLHMTPISCTELEADEFGRERLSWLPGYARLRGFCSDPESDLQITIQVSKGEKKATSIVSATVSSSMSFKYSRLIQPGACQTTIESNLEDVPAIPKPEILVSPEEAAPPPGKRNNMLAGIFSLIRPR